jgi:hypothetical protein
MSRVSPVQLAAVLALALLDDTRAGVPEGAPDDRKAFRAAREEAERRRSYSVAQHQAQVKAENDAIAAPYREARRLRNMKKVAEGHWKGNP